MRTGSIVSVSTNAAISIAFAVGSGICSSSSSVTGAVWSFAIS